MVFTFLSRLDLLNVALAFQILILKIYTQTKVKQHHIFFGDTVLEVAEWNMWVWKSNILNFIVNFITFMST